MTFLHERRPAILEPSDWPPWLGETEGDSAALLPPLAANLRGWPISARVNKARNDDPSLPAPLEAGQI